MMKIPRQVALLHTSRRAHPGSLDHWTTTTVFSGSSDESKAAYREWYWQRPTVLQGLSYIDFSKLPRKKIIVSQMGSRPRNVNMPRRQFEGFMDGGANINGIIGPGERISMQFPT
jgi:hypothetical protein